MQDIDDRVSRKCERENRQALAWIAHHRDGSDEQEAHGKRHVEANARLVLVHDGEADIRTRRQREDQRRELREAQFSNQAVRRRSRHRGCSNRLPGKPESEAAKCHHHCAKRFAHEELSSRKLSGSMWYSAGSTGETTLSRPAWPRGSQRLRS